MSTFSRSKNWAAGILCGAALGVGVVSAPVASSAPTAPVTVVAQVTNDSETDTERNTPTVDESETGSTPWGFIGLAVVLIIVIGLLVMVLLRRRAGGTPEEGH